MIPNQILFKVGNNYLVKILPIKSILKIIWILTIRTPNSTCVARMKLLA